MGFLWVLHGSGSIAGLQAIERNVKNCKCRWMGGWMDVKGKESEVINKMAGTRMI